MADNQMNTGSRSGGTSGATRTVDTGSLDPERVIESAKNMGSEVIGTVRDQATSLLDEQRSRAADQIASVAGMVRNSVQSLDQQSSGTIRRYAEDTAQQIDEFADTLRNRSWNDLAADVEDFARRWPGVFMASAFAAGFVAGRFLVSSGSRASQPRAPAQTTPTSTGMSHEPRGGARYDYGAVGGGVSGSGNSGYGSSGSRESF